MSHKKTFSKNQFKIFNGILERIPRKQKHGGYNVDIFLPSGDVYHFYYDAYILFYKHYFSYAILWMDKNVTLQEMQDTPQTVLDFLRRFLVFSEMEIHT